MSHHRILWRGELLPAEALPRLIEEAGPTLAKDLSGKLPTVTLLEACERLAQRLVSGSLPHLKDSLAESGVTKARAAFVLERLAIHFRKRSLYRKLKCELGTTEPFGLRRPQLREMIFESWAPVGVLVHIAPGNAATVAPLTVLEGLLAGNINLLKLSSREGPFAVELLKALVDQDLTGTLARYVYAFHLPSSQTETLQTLLGHADGVSAWGGEAAISAVRELAPSTARMVAWGHKLSFAYVTREKSAETATLAGLAKDICEVDQQACSSPQCIALDTESAEELKAFAVRLAGALTELSPTFPAQVPGLTEQAERTTVTENVRAEEAEGEAEAIVAPDGSWRILVDYRSGLSPSPLYRTIWLVRLPRARLLEDIYPLRSYLQTVGLACTPKELPEISREILSAGATRITPVGAMTLGYTGEPHDGVYALPRYCRRVSLLWTEGAETVSDMTQFEEPDVFEVDASTPVLTKELFLSQEVPDEDAQLYIESGGSTGTPKVSLFRYDDLEEQMMGSAHGHIAAGFDPVQDRSINLMSGGHLYGGLITKYMALAFLRAVQLPMGRIADSEFVADSIIRHRVNTLMGMPGYIMLLFKEQGEKLKAYGGLEKIFYAGEHFDEQQRALLKQEYGLKLVKSLIYGTTDCGPVAYACGHCDQGRHHVMSKTQRIEIFDIEQDRPAEPGAAGRILITSLQRQGQDIRRYDIGDLGKWVDEPCACGRKDPVFQLLGRHGDVFRVGGNALLHYQRVAEALSGGAEYVGHIQLVIRRGDPLDEVLVRLDESAGVSPASAREAIVRGYGDIQTVVEELGTATLRVEAIPRSEFVLTATTGKVRSVIDERSSGG